MDEIRVLRRASQCLQPRTTVTALRGPRQSPGRWRKRPSFDLVGSFRLSGSFVQLLLDVIQHGPTVRPWSSSALGEVLTAGAQGVV